MLGEGGGRSGSWELRTAFSQLRIRSCRMSIIAFELPIMEMAFALIEFELKVFTLAIDFQFRIVTFGNRFLNLLIWVLTFNGYSRPPYYRVVTEQYSVFCVARKFILTEAMKKKNEKSTCFENQRRLYFRSIVVCLTMRTLNVTEWQTLSQKQIDFLVSLQSLWRCS